MMIDRATRAKEKMWKPRSSTRVTLGRDLLVEPTQGSIVVAEKDGYLWSFIHTGYATDPREWYAATISDDMNKRAHTWEDITNNWEILAVFDNDKCHP